MIFPGTTAHVATKDVNRLDGDSANLEQSIGEWKNDYTIASIALSADISPQIGTKTLKVTSRSAPEASQINVWCGAVTGGIPAAASTEYVFSVWVYCTETDRTMDPQLSWYSAANTLLGHTYSNDLPLSVGWSQIVLAGTSPVDTDHVVLKCGYESTVGDVPADEAFYLDAVLFAVGTDPTFEPSLRIVGSLYEEVVPADMPVVFAGDGTPLTVGEGWAGNGYAYNRYDGADSSALLVASFQAGDVPVAAQLPG